jgi:hypothetical protein
VTALRAQGPCPDHPSEECYWAGTEELRLRLIADVSIANAAYSVFNKPARRDERAVVAPAFDATSASTECAWVLWQYPYDPSKRQAVDSPEVVAGAVPVGAYGDEPTCKSVMASENKTHASRLLDPAIKGVRPWYTLCLPDTIDPRGPKGK